MSKVKIRVGDMVEAGTPGTEDHDTGKVIAMTLEVAGKMVSTTAVVAWFSGVRTWTPMSDLRRIWK